MLQFGDQETVLYVDLETVLFEDQEKVLFQSKLCAQNSDKSQQLMVNSLIWFLCYT